MIELPNAKKAGVHEVNLEARYSIALDNVERIWRGSAADVKAEFESTFAVPMSNPDYTQEGDGWTAAEFKPHACVIVFGNNAEIRKDNNQ